MQERRLSRNKSLKIPRILKSRAEELNTTQDLFAAQKAFALAEGKKCCKSPAEEIADKELEQVSKIPENSSDLIVITKAKKLGAYVIAITAKSPAKFRGVFVNRMQNFCMDTVENLLNANFIRSDDTEKREQREIYQTNAIIKLKMLAYISMVAENAGCILKRQYKQISLQIGETINLTAAWKKSDAERWRKKEI